MTSKKTSPLEVYREALKLTDEDSLHDVIAQAGPGILDHKLPYVVRAARWQSASRHRRDKRRNNIVFENVGSCEPICDSLWDPYERVAHNQVLKIITDALAILPDDDIHALWMNLTGHSDEEIQNELSKSKFGTKMISVALIRKRRQRSLERIKRITCSKLRTSRK